MEGQSIVMNKSLLLHICCAPCCVMSLQTFRDKGYDVLGYFFNPNIHPYREFVSRKETLRSFLDEENITYIMDEGYPLEDFLRLVLANEQDRCLSCYRLRLETAAQKAAELGIEHFTTTLLISPYQKHESIKTTGEEIAQNYGVSFLYVDLRPLFRESQRLAREKGFYMQSYCGCIFSEKERYLKNN